MTIESAAIDAAVRADLLRAAGMITLTNGTVMLDGVPMGRRPSSAAMRQALLAHLALAMYGRWFAGSGGAEVSPVAGDGGPGVVALVRAAHAATARFETGWIARAIHRDAAVVATKAGEDVRFGPLDYANVARPAVPVRPGDSLAVTRRRDSVDQAAGWWLSWSAYGAVPETSMVRIYWNAGADLIAQLVRSVTTLFEDRGLAYMMKCPIEPRLFARVDPVVVYLAPEAWLAARGALRELHEQLAPLLRPSVPPLALRLGRGVAVAEDPGDGQSFGQSRSQAITDGALQAAETGVADPDDIVAALATTLAAHGISPTRPYLKINSPADAVVSW